MKKKSFYNTSIIVIYYFLERYRYNFNIKNVERGKYYEDSGVIYEILCTNKDYVITQEILKKKI